MSLPSRPVVYFCAEFGIISDLPLYAGGLGILAGDTLKAAADARYPMIGVGLLYRGEQGKQWVTTDGWQVDEKREFSAESFGFTKLRKTVKVPIGTEIATCTLWYKPLGPVTGLLLLSPDHARTPPALRELCAQPYCCSDLVQLQEQVLLGVGGVRALKTLDIHPSVYHCNEGRPSFLHWELAASQDTTPVVYTNHTLLHAGNQTYDLDFVRELAKPFTNTHVQLSDLVAPGEVQATRFSVTEYALAKAKKISGVSQPHTQLAQKQWANYSWVNCTNGVHFPTWQRPQLRKSSALSDEQLWSSHQSEKQRLADFVLKKTGFGYDPQRLVIGWARRITTYKRLESLFGDVARLASLLKKTECPVQLLISGKAHPGDDEAKRALQHVIHLFQNELSGSALYIPDYNIEIAQHMVAGSDVWLNTPEPEWEACGTSGMKALSNGVLPFSPREGWVAEIPSNTLAEIGWELTQYPYNAQLLSLLEHQIIPNFFSRDSSGIPRDWVRRMRVAIANSTQWSAERMLREYDQKLYH